MDGSGFHVKIHRLVMMRLGEILDLMIFLTALVSNQQLSSLDLALSKRSLSDAFNVAYRTSERARLAAVFYEPLDVLLGDIKLRLTVWSRILLSIIP